MVLSFSAIVFYAQEFAPVGAEWYYDESYAFSGDIDYIKFTSEKDTLINNQLCKKITKRHKILCNDRPYTEYVYASNDTVYFLDTIFNEFQVLYVFSADPLDSWIIKVKDEDHEIDTVSITVNSVSTIEINGQDLRALDVTYFKNDEQRPESRTSTIIEKIGDIEYMFNWYPWSTLACDGNISNGLRCYQDSEIGLYSSGIRDSCEYTYIWTGVFEIEESNLFHLYPNPAQDYTMLEIESMRKYLIEIFDSNGKLIKSKMSEDSTCCLDLSLIENGYYLIRISKNNQLIGYKKLIKQ